jgi:restriction system protein
VQNDAACNFYKRRNVEWVEVKGLNQLDSIFYQIKKNRHALSNVNGFAKYIDKVIKTLFVKNGFSHFVLDINKEEEINLVMLLQLIENARKLMDELNSTFNLGDSVDQSSISINLQSPGKLELRLLNGKSLILLAMLLGPLGANIHNSGASTEVVEKLEQFKKVNKVKLDEMDKAFQELEVDRNKINQI